MNDSPGSIDLLRIGPAGWTPLGDFDQGTKKSYMDLGQAATSSFSKNYIVWLVEEDSDFNGASDYWGPRWITTFDPASREGVKRLEWDGPGYDYLMELRLVKDKNRL